MPMLDHLWIILALPLAGAAINGLLGKNWPKSAVNSVAIGSVSLAFLAVVETTREFLQLPANQIPWVRSYFTVDDRRAIQSQFRAASGPAHHRDAAHRHLRRHADSHLLHRLHGARRRLLPFLQLPESVHVLHAHARARRELSW